ncbi:MAG: threonine synthase [Gaiellaceae bacterium]
MDVISKESRSLVERYRDRLLLDPAAKIVTLGEGSAPILRAEHLSERWNAEVYILFDGANPTGSFKDRGMTVAVSQALHEGARAVICASTGNTAASSAAYAARAGLTAIVLQPEGAIAAGKLAQSQALGARLLAVRGSFETTLKSAQELAACGDFVLVNSVNPYRLEGQKTAAFELIEALGRAPEILALPYGGGGNTAACFKGFSESGEGMPRFCCAQAEHRSTTVASAIRIAEPVHAEEVAEAIAVSMGEIVTVTDEQILAAWKDLASHEGIFCEPASAAGIAALEVNPPEPGSLVACIVTGHGLKDPDIAMKHSPEPIPVDPDPDSIARAVK